MNYAQFLHFAHQNPKPVILLEGTRQLPSEDRAKLVELAQMLAVALPHARFRTGNASGSDEAFAVGVSRVDPQRLEYVLPFESMRSRSRKKQALCLSLEDVPSELEAQIIAATIKASPKYRGLVHYRQTNTGLKIKSSYILRDTVKVMGIEGTAFAAAYAGIFYVNPEHPGKGGTGHTMRVCHQFSLPVVTQDTWLTWLSQESDS
jgi:hypothetical protein